MEMNNTKAYPLKIGTMSLYCDKMTMESGTLVSVSPTVTGISYITNKCKQPTRLTFTGRMYTPKYPMLSQRNAWVNFVFPLFILISVLISDPQLTPKR